MDRGSPACSTDELSVSTVRGNTATNHHTQRREGRHKTHGTHDVLATWKQTNSITGIVKLWKEKCCLDNCITSSNSMKSQTLNRKQ